MSSSIGSQSPQIKVHTLTVPSPSAIENTHGNTFIWPEGFFDLPI